MFVQVIKGKVSDAAAMRQRMDAWVDEMSPGAKGWLGSTGGVTDDGTFVAVARFDSEEQARANSQRPEQDAWWYETSRLFTGEVSFDDSVFVLPDVQGDPDKATFVQVMQGTGKDPERARELMQQDSEKWAGFRPDMLGSLSIEHSEGRWTMAMWFTSEEDAREGEKKEVPPELQAQMDEMNALSTSEPVFYDLRDPWFSSPKA